MDWISKVFGVNWKSNLIAFVAVLTTIPAFITAIQQWMNHQPVDWRMAAGGTLLALLAWVVKDASTHSTPAQVNAALAKAVAVTPAQADAAAAQAKAADVQAKGKTP